MNVLDTIIAQKRKEVSLRKSAIPVAALERLKPFQLPTPSLKKALLEGRTTGIIAEFKRQSPSKGLINGKASVEEVTTAYAQHGAAGISVLTDAQFFGGSLFDLLAATVNEVPLLRKDFTVDEYQLVEAKAFGAGVILLIAACLSPVEVKTLATAAKGLGLEVLLEVHNEAELGHVCEAVDLVGVNNRDLKTFNVSVQTSLDLVGKIPADKPAVAESGITDAQTILSLKRAGFKGFLIGEAFMKAPNPAIAFADFVQTLNATA